VAEFVSNLSPAVISSVFFIASSAILLGIVAVSFGYLFYESIMIWRIKND